MSAKEVPHFLMGQGRRFRTSHSSTLGRLPDCFSTCTQKPSRLLSTHQLCGSGRIAPCARLCSKSKIWMKVFHKTRLVQNSIHCKTAQYFKYCPIKKNTVLERQTDFQRRS